jgi:tripartite-type tricarboxylate transporter receptor subunit TctC
VRVTIASLSALGFIAVSLLAELFEKRASSFNLPSASGQSFCRVKAIAVSSRERQSFNPLVPTVIETGVAKLIMASWFGLFASSATPTATIQRLRTEFANILAQPELIERFQRTVVRRLKLSASEAESFFG